MTVLKVLIRNQFSSRLTDSRQSDMTTATRVDLKFRSLKYFGLSGIPQMNFGMVHTIPTGSLKIVGCDDNVAVYNEYSI